MPFNTTQYAELTLLFAKDLGVAPGILTHVIADAHIYDNQMSGVERQLAYYDVLEKMNSVKSGGAVAYDLAEKAAKIYNERTNTGLPLDAEFICNNANTALSSSPIFRVKDGTPTDFFKVDTDDCSICDYNNMGKIDFGDVAV